MRDRLICLIKNAEKTFPKDKPVLDIEEFVADYILANGAIVPPCKVGQTLYDITEFLEECNCPQIYEYKDNAMYIEKVGKDRFLFTYDGMCIHPEDIGKTVFLTREEAEAALKGR